MPHTKRKGKVRGEPSTPISSLPIQPNIGNFFTRLGAETPGMFPGIGVGGEQTQAPLDFNISLSPGEPKTPLPPSLSLPPNLVEDNQPTGLKEASPIEGILEEEVSRHFSLGNTKQNGVPSTSTPEGSGGGAEASEVRSKACPQGLVNILDNSSVSQTQPVTLETIWSTLTDLKTIILNLNATIIGTQNQISKIEPSVVNHEEKLSKLENRCIQVEKIQTGLIQGEMLNNRKLEMIENQIRYNNIRLLNFPNVKLISSFEQFKNFMKENLKLTEGEIPKLEKIYFIAMGRKRIENSSQKIQQISSSNLTTFLEQSMTEQVEFRGTLCVKFLKSTDRDKILKLCLKNREMLFLGQKMWTFPDITRTTQVRRKIFLQMVQEVKAIGALCTIYYPCKCVVKYQQERFVFLEPSELRSFLDAKLPVTTS
ncbi:uncharacterized protein LOC115093257 [Rhinatrema bivittatum]|uniref:uncharacterized protein LOC115093257 n=1 Tax=Rhinatrema bivittatum TaxID=194408 RepID=UPI00112B7B8D|nr:uncharacterized protein LOC115093257 [Rhinatrema bivittatum]